MGNNFMGIFPWRMWEIKTVDSAIYSLSTPSSAFHPSNYEICYDFHQTNDQICRHRTGSRNT